MRSFYHDARNDAVASCCTEGGAERAGDIADLLRGGRSCDGAAVGPIERYLSEDHERLAHLFEQGRTDPAAYEQFRVGLLRHIGMEEKVLLPAARRARGGEPLPAAERLKLDHGALVALMVPPPSAPIRAAVEGILARHNVLEEGEDGVYSDCEKLAGTAGDELLALLRAYPDVAVHPHFDSEVAVDAARRALARAGYVLEDFES